MKNFIGFVVFVVLFFLAAMGNLVQYSHYEEMKYDFVRKDSHIKSLEGSHETQLAIVEQRIEFWKRSYDELLEKMYARQPAQEVVLTNPDYELVFILDGPLTVNHRWDLDVVYEPFDAAGRMFHGPIDSRVEEMAKRLRGINGIASVQFEPYKIIITKGDFYSWEELLDPIDVALTSVEAPPAG